MPHPMQMFYGNPNLLQGSLYFNIFMVDTRLNSKISERNLHNNTCIEYWKDNKLRPPSDIF